MYLTVDSPQAAAPRMLKKTPPITASSSNGLLSDAPSTIRLDKSVGRLIDGMVEGRIDVLALQTAEALDDLERSAQRIGRRFGLITGLRRVMKICGDQRTVDALEGLGLDADIVAPSPYSSAELAATLSSVPVDGMCVAVVYRDVPESVIAGSVVTRCRSLEGYFVA